MEIKPQRGNLCNMLCTGDQLIDEIVIVERHLGPRIVFGLSFREGDTPTEEKLMQEIQALWPLYGAQPKDLAFPISTLLDAPNSEFDLVGRTAAHVIFFNYTKGSLNDLRDNGQLRDLSGLIEALRIFCAELNTILPGGNHD